MKTRIQNWLATMAALLAAAGIAFAQAPAWKTAEPGWRYEWPRDHSAHRDFKTEWWYFTGELRTAEGRRFGVWLTFFRQGIPLENGAAVQSRFITDSIKFGHFTITDVGAKNFHFAQQLSRGAFGEAGFEDGGRLAWLGEWSLTLDKDGAMRLAASEGGRSLSLRLESAKPLAVHGADGISKKAMLPGFASHYYSGTRLRSQGSLTIGGQTLPVTGESWFDHEWASNPLAPEQCGWDWFSVQFDDGSELMLYRLRRRDGSVDEASSGSFIAADGSVRHLKLAELKLTPTRYWQSSKTRGKYPVGWRVEIASLGLDVQVTTPVDSQELVLEPISYWEGLIDIRGSREGRQVHGHGYLELTGYAGDLVGL